MVNHLTVMKQEVEKLEQIRNALSLGAVQADGLQQLVTKFVESEVTTLMEALECLSMTDTLFKQINAQSERFANQFTDIGNKLSQFETEVQVQTSWASSQLTNYPLGQMKAEIDALKNQVAQLPTGAASTNPDRTRFDKGILECKAITNMNQLGSDKNEYRNWEDRMINAYIQYAGKETRKVFKLIIDSITD